MENNAIVIIVIAQAIIALISGFIIKSFLPSYFSKKGENLATKEDIAEITEKIESVRMEFAQQQHRGQIAFDKEFELLVEIWNALFELKMATLTLRQPESVKTDEEYSDIKQERRKEFAEKYEIFGKIINKYEPFYPSPIYQELEKLRELSRKEADDSRYLGTLGNGTPKYWRDAEENQDKILSCIDVVSALIRKRYSE